MKISDFSLLSRETVQFACDVDLSSEWKDGESVTVMAQDDVFILRQGNAVCGGKIVGGQYHTAIQVQRGLTLWVLLKRHGKVLYLQSLDLVQRISLDMTITVDEKIAEQLASSKRPKIPKPDVNAAVAWLSSYFIADSNTSDSKKKCIFVSHHENRTDNVFEIYGQGWKGTVKQNKLIKLTNLRSSAHQISMVEGEILFQDASVAVRLQSEEQRTLLDAALRSNGSYLKLWEQYGALELEQARYCAKELGSLQFKNAELNEGELWAWSLKVDVDHLKEFRKRWKALDLPGTTQVEIVEKELNLDFEAQDAAEKGERSRRRSIRGQLEFKKDSVILTLPQDEFSEQPPLNGFIYYSLSGDEVVQKRRASAKQSINAGGPMPQLHFLLEGVAPPTSPRPALDGLSAYAKACFNKGPPTERQKLALDVAINTPDIAIIVGPPGTGKTQVIAALQRRIAETLDKNSLQHQVLISSYQHDAVDNALNRTQVFGLPAIRKGGRGRRDEGGIDPVRDWSELKQKEIAQKLNKLRLDEPQTKPLEELDRRITALRLASLSAKERQEKFEQIDVILRQLFDLDIHLPADLKDQWEVFLAQQGKVATLLQAKEQSGILRSLRALRTSTISYADDGSDKVHQLERILRRNNAKNMEDSDWHLLLRLSKVDCATEEDLSELSDFKNSMIDKELPDYRPPQLKQALSGEVLGLLADIVHAIDAPLSKSRHGISAVVASFHNSLVHDPDEAKRAVHTYASIVGATCQQSAGVDMNKLKTADTSEKIEFDTVIIDEAARANPLDLFVPMAMARRRIILVGDHRQLPHLIQRELEDELISKHSLTEAQGGALRLSLFERLVKQLQEQEKVDNIQRVVMLDTQYRMHPALGEFISKQFYEPKNLGKLKSVRPAKDFAHSIPGYLGKCAAWLDIPLHEGKEERRGSSRARKSEAQAIAKEVKKIADACGPTLSIGVISFYTAQRDLILEELVKQGLAERKDDGKIQITQHYLKTDSNEERLSVGTVDAFQGKEFDVVFLSIVRANDIAITDQKEDADLDQLQSKKYGHLRVDNRLNVAMSRQRKLLVAVGDKRMAEGPESELAVPALTGFLRLCSEEQANGR